MSSVQFCSHSSSHAQTSHTVFLLCPNLSSPSLLLLLLLSSSLLPPSSCPNHSQAFTSQSSLSLVSSSFVVNCEGCYHFCWSPFSSHSPSSFSACSYKGQNITPSRILVILIHLVALLNFILQLMYFGLFFLRRLVQQLQEAVSSGN